jgi:hypothetical protein
MSGFYRDGIAFGYVLTTQTSGVAELDSKRSRQQTGNAFCGTTFGCAGRHRVADKLANRFAPTTGCKGVAVECRRKRLAEHAAGRAR